jgi:hypothetical protein
VPFQHLPYSAPWVVLNASPDVASSPTIRPPSLLEIHHDIDITMSVVATQTGVRWGDVPFT